MFWAFVQAGKELAGLHIDYEKLEPYPLKYIEAPSVAPGSSVVAAVSDRRSSLKKESAVRDRRYNNVPLSYRVEDKMRLSKDRKALKVNESSSISLAISVDRSNPAVLSC